jgi:hypothetical protein
MMPGVDQGGQEGRGEPADGAPSVRSPRIFRSRRRGLIDWLLCTIRLYPFRCDDCGPRFRRGSWRGR